MGWDTESGVTDLDLDLSLVPLDAKKNIITNKLVYYQQKTPSDLACPRDHRGYISYGMRAFNDDRSGDEPGDDELVKLDLGCLTQYHSDIETVAVVVNIFRPRGLTWSDL